ncbi:MAG: TIGR03790 family protein [Verrucomicrobiota bacterium JB022]|nr:TIGR03790 family protein [Verrucomicrobiota bacterium JB022]
MQRLCLLICLLVASYASAAVTHPWAVRTVLVVNEAVPGSRQVAEFYQQLRGIPGENIVTINTRATGSIDRTGFVQNIYNPILKQLLERELLKGQLLGDVTQDGRERAQIVSSQVRYLVPVYGVPYMIGENRDFRDPEQLKAFFNRYAAGTNAPRFEGGPLDVTRASVDSELATMPLDGAPLAGFIPNPLFKQEAGFLDGSEPFFRVTRLDGPSPEVVIENLRRTVAAESAGLIGCSAFDRDGRGGGFKMGNNWITGAQKVAENLHYPVYANDAREVIPLGTVMPPIAIYFGWYAQNVTGMFEQPGFRFAPGAIAAHLHSFSAQSIRGKDKWVGPLLERGASAVVGNTSEPYLTYTHNFDLLLEALARGATFGDAAYYSYPVLSWQGVAIGDPLYRPFQVPLAAQVAAVEAKRERDWNELDAYVLVREVNRLRNVGESGDANRLGRRVAEAVPLPMVLRALGTLAMRANEEGEARRYLKTIDPAKLKTTGIRPLDWLAYADLAARLKLDDRAVAAYDLAIPAIQHQQMRKAAVERAAAGAEQVGDKKAAERFKAMDPAPDSAP